MTEALKNQYKSLEVSALNKEGCAYEARRQAEGLIKYAERCEGEAIALREELGHIAQMLTEEPQDLTS